VIWTTPRAVTDTTEPGPLSEGAWRISLNAGTRKPSPRPGPKKIFVARLPVTRSDLFGREEDIAFLDRAWANKDANVRYHRCLGWGRGTRRSSTIGSGEWLLNITILRSSFLAVLLLQGHKWGSSSADEFLDAALAWFGDPDPRIGTAWEKGERLAKLVAHRRSLL
jgi:hypothetical protein